MDAYDNKLGIFEEKKVYSNAIFSLDESCISEKFYYFLEVKIIDLLQIERMI